MRGAYPYRDSRRATTSTTSSTMLADGIATSRGRSGAFLHSRSRQRPAARDGAARASRRSPRGGAIPETANYNVVAEPDGHVVGTLDEDFAVESMAGDIFLLGTTSWRIRRVETGVVRVEDAHGAPPIDSVLERRRPRPHDRALARSRGRARRNRRARRCAAHALLDRANAGSTTRAPSRPIAYVRAGKAILGVVPTDTHDRRRALLRRSRRDAAHPAHAVRRAHQPRVGPGAAQAVLPLVQFRTASRGHRQRHRPLADRAARLSARDRVRVRQVGQRRVRADPSAACRADVRRALALERDSRARDPAHARRPQSAAATPAHARRRSCSRRSSPTRPRAPENLTGPIRIPDHVLVRETIDNCLHEAMDLDGLLDVLRSLEAGDDSHGRGRHARAVAVLSRDPQRQSVRVSRRRAARGAPRARRAAAAHDPQRRRRRRHARSRSDRRGRRRVVAGRARRRRTARCASDARRAAAGRGVDARGSTNWSRSAARRR